MFDPDAPDNQLSIFALTRLLVARSGLPVIAAGGIMDGRGVRAALDLGAVAAQMDTAFIGCPESGADAARRLAVRQSAQGRQGAALDLMQGADLAEALAHRLAGGLN